MASAPIPSLPQEHQYPVWTAPPSQTTLVDLRVQILANASILLPVLSDPSITPDRLEITTARFVPRASLGRHYKYYAMLVLRPRPFAAANRPQGVPPPRLAVLVKGKPLDSEMAALAWMLNETEERMHSLAQTKQAVTEETCCLM